MLVIFPLEQRICTQTHFIVMFFCTLPVLLWSEGVKTTEADDLQQVQKLAVQTGSFAPQKHASAFCGCRCNSQASEILTSHMSPNSLDCFHRIITCLNNYKKPCVDEDYLMKLRAQCIHGLNWQLPLQMGLVNI